MRALVPILIGLACRNETKSTVAEPEDAIVVTDMDGDGFEAGEDCDDNNDTVYPGADEQCDGIDSDCDGELDNGVTISYYADSDGDGYGNPSITTEACAAPDGFVANGSDCDDAESSAYPGAEERCDGIDNDCNEEIDEGLDGQYYVDADGDGFGDSAQVVEGCQLQVGLSTVDGDCDDTDATISPIANEACDGIDNNCNATIDEGVTNTYYQDADTDGYGDPDSAIEACELPSGAVNNAFDCNDGSAAINPDADEQCNGVDDDCDGVADEEGAVGSSVFYTDGDGDGYGDLNAPVLSCTQQSGTVTDATDCDDTNSIFNPGMTEICNGFDDDCDGDTDEDGAAGATTYYADADGDGQGASSASVIIESCSAVPPLGYSSTADDCNDNNNSVYTGAAETCNGVDDDCDSATDEEAVDAISHYVDQDGDGFGADSSLTESCTLPANASLLGGDCDDSQVSVSPVGVEVCDQLDNDCDGSTDAGAIDAATVYVDGDGDGYGDPLQSVQTCDTAGYSLSGDDCDDGNSLINPDMIEAPNGIDDNCDGIIDEGTVNFDNDGDGYSVADGDCDDTDTLVNPGEAELCDGADNNCDGNVDEGVIGSAQCAGVNCQEILDLNPSATDGVYTIDPDGDGLLLRDAYCDMSTDGGGWTKLGSAQYPFFFSVSSWDQYGSSEDANFVYLTDLDDFAVNGTYTLRYVVGSSTDWLDIREHYTVWSQDHNPFTSSTNGSDYVYIAGEESTTCNGFNGLHHNYQGYSRATDVDSSDNYGCWWQQVIPIAYYNWNPPGYLEGYDGPNTHTWQSIWVR